MKALDKCLPAICFALVVVLTGFGVMMVYSSSVFKYSSNQYHFFIRELIWAFAGMGAMAAMARVPLESVRKFAPWAFVLALGALALVFSPLGTKVYGAQRWINLGFFRFQPSEAMKYACILMVAWWYDGHKKEAGTFMKGFAIPACLIGLTFCSIAIEKDLGTPLLICTVAVAMCLMGGMKIRYVLCLGLAGLALMAAMIIKEPYRMRRMMSFLDPMADSMGSSYQTVQSLMAISSGGHTGVGLGDSIFKTSYLPEAHTDFIYAIIGEELGFAGSAGLVLAYLLLFLVMWRIVCTIEDTFCRLTCYGIMLTIAFQAVINMGVVTACLPNKGLGLPFISYGGSALLFLLAACGLFLNMSQNKIRSATRYRARIS